MISMGDLFVYGSLAAADVYVFWTLYRANKAIDRYQGLMDRISKFVKQFEDPKTMRKTIRSIFGPEIKKSHELLDMGKVYSDPRVITSIFENAIMNFMAHIGAKNLKELGYKKEQINRITMAKNGIQAAGNLAAEGAGLNNLIAGVANKIPNMGGGGEGGPPDMMSMIMQYFMGSFVGGGNQPKGPTQGSSGGGGTIG